MDSILEQFMTPNEKRRDYRNYSTDRFGSTTRHCSKHKHIPIFKDSHRKGRDHRVGRIFSTNLAPDTSHRILCSNSTRLEEQNLTALNIINYDFCGCEDKLTPCHILVQTFLTRVHMNQLKQSYTQELDGARYRQMGITNYDRKLLFKNLPKQYPEVYQTHLSNLVDVLQLGLENRAEFQCLYSIQYHSKIQYLTYFLYKDMKKSYSNIGHLLQLLDCQLIKYNTSALKLKYLYNMKFLAAGLDQFINEYFASVGANLIPVTHYAKFMVAIFKGGCKFMVRLLAKFVVHRRHDLEQGLMYLRCAEYERYRNYMRELNFQDIIQNTN